jgi:cytochrome c-type biogenesis protein CcmE
VTKRTRNAVVTVLVLACGAGLLIWAAVDAQWVQTISAQEFIDNAAAYKGKTLQVYGKVAPGSVKEQGQAMEFELYWPKGQEKTGGLLQVNYSGLRKVDLVDAADVLIDCRVDENNMVNATRILTKCPSKYMKSKK